MRLVASVVAFALLGSLSAAAEVLVSQHDNIDDGGTLTIPLPLGAVDITMNTVEGYGLFVHAGGSHEVLLDSAHMPRLLKTYQNSALLELNMGTSACPIMFAWVTYDATGLRTSEEFGTCAEEATYEQTATGPLVAMDDPATAGTIVSFLYDEASGALSSPRPSLHSQR